MIGSLQGSDSYPFASWTTDVRPFPAGAEDVERDEKERCRLACLCVLIGALFVLKHSSSSDSLDFKERKRDNPPQLAIAFDSWNEASEPDSADDAASSVSPHTSLAFVVAEAIEVLENKYSSLSALSASSSEDSAAFRLGRGRRLSSSMALIWRRRTTTSSSNMLSKYCDIF